MSTIVGNTRLILGYLSEYLSHLGYLYLWRKGWGLDKVLPALLEDLAKTTKNTHQLHSLYLHFFINIILLSSLFHKMRNWLYLT